MEISFRVILSSLRRPFADPSHKLRASAQDFGSGQRLRERKRPKNPFLSERPYSVILTLSLSDGEESPKETLRLRLRVTSKKRVTKRVTLTLFFPTSSSIQLWSRTWWQKGSFCPFFLSFCPFFPVILTLSEAKGKNLNLFSKQVF